MLIRILKSMFSAVKEEYKKILHEREQNRLYKIWSTKWNNDLDWIQSQMDKSTELGCFKWRKLVMQEIEMWASIAKKFSMMEIDFLVERRGFTNIQRQYLIDHAKNMGLLISEEQLERIKINELCDADKRLMKDIEWAKKEKANE